MDTTTALRNLLSALSRTHLVASELPAFGAAVRDARAALAAHDAAVDAVDEELCTADDAPRVIDQSADDVDIEYACDECDSPAGTRCRVWCTAVGGDGRYAWNAARFAAALTRLATLRAEVARLGAIEAASDALRDAAWEANRHGGSTALHNAIASYDQARRAELREEAVVPADPAQHRCPDCGHTEHDYIDCAVAARIRQQGTTPPLPDTTQEGARETALDVDAALGSGR